MADNTLSYGFYDHSALAASRLSEIGGQTVYSMITDSARMHTERVNALIDRMVLRTTNFKWRFMLPSPVDLQPATGSTQAASVRPDIKYDVALPLQMGSVALGMDHVAAAKATLAEVEAKTMSILMGDGRWLRRHILAALFTNTAWDFTDEQHGALSVKTLACADGTLYPTVSGGTEDSQHFIAQASGVADGSNPYPTIYAQLSKHPSNMVSADTPVVCYIPTNLVSATKGLADFVAVADADIRTGADNDVILANAARLNEIRGFGKEVLGKVSNCWIVEWDALPDSYIVAHATGAGPILGMREDPEVSLQGLYTVQTSTGLIETTQFNRRAGFGVINRVAGLVYRVGNGSYAIPTGYTAPLAA